jgi:hypothetical protein
MQMTVRPLRTFCGDTRNPGRNVSDGRSTRPGEQILERATVAARTSTRPDPVAGLGALGSYPMTVLERRLLDVEDQRTVVGNLWFDQDLEPLDSGDVGHEQVARVS